MPAIQSHPSGKKKARGARGIFPRNFITYGISHVPVAPPGQSYFYLVFEQGYGGSSGPITTSPTRTTSPTQVTRG